MPYVTKLAINVENGPHCTNDRKNPACDETFKIC